ncbi:MAG TPA: discoidin domain-containing protein [Opitutaceae bacterium]|nr:discoidin domain-containing protein [Opitutaceae bacterium]
MSKSSFILLLALAGAVGAAAQEKVALPLELPKPLFVGTPAPISVPNLEKPRGTKRPDLMVPAGTVLLSRGKPVTASDTFPVIGDLPYVTDGDKKGNDGTFVEFGPELQWVQIDLEKPATIRAIALWHFHAQARVYHDVVVQVSDDPEFKGGVTTVFNNDHDNSAKLGAGKDQAYIETNEGKLIEVAGVKGRYVRLYSNGNTTDELNHYVEVEVFGQPAG